MNDTPNAFRADQDRLADDLKAVVNDAEDLLRHAARDAGEGCSEARQRLEQRLKDAKGKLHAVEDAIMSDVHEAGRKADQYVRRHPWESIGAGAAVGLLVGILLARR